MAEPRSWTLAELAADAAEGRARFRAERLEEPRDLYVAFFDEMVPVFETLTLHLEALFAEAGGIERIVDVVSDRQAGTAFRYLAAPPISEDDLRTLTDARLSRKELAGDPDAARRVRAMVRQIIDPRRFPWIIAGRPARPGERYAAVVASAALVAAQRVQTSRRGDAKAVQEEAVKDLLRGMGFVERPPRDIPMLADAPAAGEFCGESRLGDTRADLVIGLFDRRALAVECKVSNSEVNSFKRVNHEAAGKAAKWNAQFGKRQLVAMAVLRGVFKPENLASAQDAGLHLVWSHRLEDLRGFVEGTRGA